MSVTALRKRDLSPISLEAGKISTISFRGEGIDGAEWLSRLDNGGHAVCNTSVLSSILLSYEYRTSHRLVKGKEYKVRIIYTDSFLATNPPTMASLRGFVASVYNPRALINLRAETVFLLREILSNKVLEQHGLMYVSVPHTPIEIGDKKYHLSLSRADEQSWVVPLLTDDTHEWPRGGAFAVLV